MPTAPEPTILPDVARLRADLRGRVVTPDDPDYDAMRVVGLGSVDARPAIIVRAADANDVAHVVNLARDGGFELAVRSGGHSGAGHSTIEGGLVLDLRDLTSIEIDVEARTAWAGAGLTAGAFTTAAAEHGLAVGFGDTGSVGLGGITLGGGVGYLVRAHGLTIDALHRRRTRHRGRPDPAGGCHERARPVLGDPGWRRQRRGRDPVPVPARVAAVGGRRDHGAARHARDASPGSSRPPRRRRTPSSSIANVMPCPPMPFVPEEHHGSLVILAMLVNAGDDDAGERAMAPFRALATPIADLVHPMPYPEIYPPDDPGLSPDRGGAHDVHGSRRRRPRRGPSSSTSRHRMRRCASRSCGSSVGRWPACRSRPPRSPTANERIMVNLAAFFAGDDDRAAKQAWLDAFAAAMDQGRPTAYVNFLGDEGEAGVRRAYPDPTWDRLAAIKRRYDPTNVFRRNQNVPPA